MERPDILCIGSVLWDVIGRTSVPMRVGMDVPGRVTRVPGGVALNIAMTLRRFGLRPALLSAVGRDAEGDELIAACARLGLEMDAVYLSDDLPTDRYMAVEGANGLIAAIADAHSLEAAGPRILAPMRVGTFGTAVEPWDGPVALDGNLTESLLAEIARSPLFARSDLHIAPASPGKAERLVPLMGHPRATFYVNLEEAGLITKTVPVDSTEAAQAMRRAGAARVLVTDGGRSASYADADGVIDLAPPPVMVVRVTGAGDTFMAAHIAAELRGERPVDALATAVRSAAQYVSGGDHP